MAALYFQKDALGITPAEAAAIAFWVGLPWSMKMVVGVSSDVYPIFGSRRKAYLLVGTLCAFGGYAYLGLGVSAIRPIWPRGRWRSASDPDVVADALSGRWRSDEGDGHVQTLAGSPAVGQPAGLRERGAHRVLGPRPVFALAACSRPVALPALRPTSERPAATPAAREAAPLGGTRAVVLIGLLLRRLKRSWLESLAVRSTRVVARCIRPPDRAALQRIAYPAAGRLSAFVIFLYRAVPGVGQGYSYWAIDHLKFDAEFLGLLAQVSSVLSLAGLILFRKPIARRPVSFTIAWVSVASFILYVPSIGLFYGANEWLGLSPRAFAFIDTTISAPLGQLAMVPMLVLIAKTAPRARRPHFRHHGLAHEPGVSASELFTRYLNTAFAVTQQSYDGLGRLMITVGVLGLVPLLAIPLLRREEARLAASAVSAPGPPPAPVQSRSNAI